MKYYVKSILIIIGTLLLIPIVVVSVPFIIGVLGITAEMAVAFLPVTIAIALVFVLAWWLRKRDQGK